jgi:hypothetical protein
MRLLQSNARHPPPTRWLASQPAMFNAAAAMLLLTPRLRPPLSQLPRALLRCRHSPYPPPPVCVQRNGTHEKVYGRAHPSEARKSEYGMKETSAML